MSRPFRRRKPFVTYDASLTETIFGVLAVLLAFGFALLIGFWYLSSCSNVE